jgi:DNA-binding NarL/FixJ family response regulator
MISVALVEDNAGLRHSLGLLVEETPGLRGVGVFANAEEALRELPGRAPEVVLMDIHLPGMSGIECTRRLREVLPAARVIIITVYRDNESIFAALRAGAFGYLLKRAAPEEIVRAIVDVHQGGAPMSGEVARKLSSREREVLELLARGRLDKEIAAELGVSLPTVRFHLKHIYEKLHVRTRVEAALKHKSGSGGPPPSGPG